MITVNARGDRCDICLNYYGLKDKLTVGSVTNMYVIMESMAQAAKAIRP